MATSMPPLADLLQQVQDALGLAASPNLSTSSAPDNVFEAYVFALVLEAAQNEGGQIAIINEPSTSTVFRFRGSPGHLWNGNYSYAYLQFPGTNSPPDLEIHTGIYLTGRSRQIHEADIAIIDADEAEFARDNQSPPRSNKTLLVTECKFYSTDLGIGLARGFVGLCSDLSTRENVFVSNSGSVSVARLLSHQRRRWQHGLTPDSNVETRFRSFVQDVFKEYKARFG
jgi:hypothetical protein